MRIAGRLVFLLSLLPGLAYAQSPGELRSAVQECLRLAALEKNLESSPVDGFYETTLSCGGDPARALYVALGRAGIGETVTQFVEGERGLTRRFGKSACYQITQGASGEPRQRFHCRIVLDVGGLLLRAF